MSALLHLLKCFNVSLIEIESQLYFYVIQIFSSESNPGVGIEVDDTKMKTLMGVSL